MLSQCRAGEAAEPAKQSMNLAALVLLGLIGGAVGTVLLLFLIGYMN